MSELEAGLIEDIAALLERMKTSELHVVWRVLSEYGPEWIGSRREICFMLDDAPLLETSLHGALREALVELVHIPATSADVVIEGEGEVARVGDTLELSYAWRAAAPYAYPSEGGRGRGVLMRLR